MSWLCAVLAKITRTSCQISRTSKGGFCCFITWVVLRERVRNEEVRLDLLQATCIPSPGWVLPSTIPLCSLISNGKVVYYWVTAGCSPRTSETGIVIQAKIKSTWVHTGNGKQSETESRAPDAQSCLNDIRLFPDLYSSTSLAVETWVFRAAWRNKIPTFFRLRHQISEFRISGAFSSCVTNSLHAYQLNCSKYPAPWSNPYLQLSDAASYREDTQLFKFGHDKLCKAEQCYYCRHSGILWCGKAMGALFLPPPSGQGFVLAQWWYTGSTVFVVWGLQRQLQRGAGGLGSTPGSPYHRQTSPIAYSRAWTAFSQVLFYEALPNTNITQRHCSVGIVIYKFHFPSGWECIDLARKWLIWQLSKLGCEWKQIAWCALRFGLWKDGVRLHQGFGSVARWIYALRYKMCVVLWRLRYLTFCLL